MIVKTTGILLYSSIAIYPFIYLIENTLKTQINNSLCQSIDNNWYKNPDIYKSDKNESKKSKSLKTREYLLEFNKYYLKEVKNPNIGDFIENYTTFGYWIATLKINCLWDSKDIKLKKLFVNATIPDLISIPSKDIYDKLVSVNDLRNNISHHNQIICTEISKRTEHKYRLGIFTKIFVIFCFIWDVRI